MKIDLVYGDDWRALYLDGKVRYEAHYLEPDWVLKYAGIEFDKHYVNLDWLDDNGGFPMNLEDVVMEDDEYAGLH